MQTTIIFIFIAILVIAALLIFYLKIQKLNQYQNDELINKTNNLVTKLALAEREAEFVRQEKTKLTLEIKSLETDLAELKAIEKTLYTDKMQLVNDCARLSSENDSLKEAYHKLEELLAKLRLELNSEFNSLKERAIYELQAKANDTLLTIGKQSVVEPLEKRLRELDEKIISLRKETQDISSKSASLSEQANNLTQALVRDSQKKGEFGEMILANILEYAGLKDKISYLEQTYLTTEKPDSKNLRPDCLIRLPEERAIIVDSKNIVGEYYKGLNEGIDKTKAINDAIQLTIKNLANKKYVEETERQTGWSVFDYMIMFIPNEGLFNLVIEQDSKLDNRGVIWSAFSQKIIIAGPSTILPLLAMIERMWQNHEIEEKILQILKIAYDLVDQLRLTLERMTILGHSINKVANNYDDVIKSFANGTNSSAYGKLSQLAGYKRELANNQPIFAEKAVKRYPIYDGTKHHIRESITNEGEID